MSLIYGFVKKFYCLAFLCVFASGCAFTSSPSGFLKDYSTLRESEQKKDLFISANTREDKPRYSKILLEPVIIHFHPDAAGVKFDPEELQELTLYLETRITKKFEESFVFTDKPGPGVLELRTAITDMKSNKFFMNTVPNYTLLSGVGLGAAAVEAEFVDSMSDEEILALKYSRKGKRIKYTKGFAKWGHTKDVLNEWVDILYEEIYKVIESE